MAAAQSIDPTSSPHGLLESRPNRNPSEAGSVFMTDEPNRHDPDPPPDCRQLPGRFPTAQEAKDEPVLKKVGGVCAGHEAETAYPREQNLTPTVASTSHPFLGPAP